MQATGRQHVALVGTSGWSYQHWRGPFYPPALLPDRFLSFYADYFLTVEVNSSFYRTPQPAMLRKWHSQTPQSFLFALKASRQITHVKRLVDIEQLVPSFLGLLAPLGEKLGPVLFQLPPGLHLDVQRLRTLLNLLPTSNQLFAVEFRHPSWYRDEVFALLSEHNVCLCIHDYPGCAAPSIITAPFVYLRLHGPKGAYAGSYSSAQLLSVAEKIMQWIASDRQVFVYFNNDEQGFAVQNALELKRLLANLTTEA